MQSWFQDRRSGAEGGVSAPAAEVMNVTNGSLSVHLLLVDRRGSGHQTHEVASLTTEMTVVGVDWKSSAQ